jgi:hypothetical protein
MNIYAEIFFLSNSSIFISRIPEAVYVFTAFPLPLEQYQLKHKRKGCIIHMVQSDKLLVLHFSIKKPKLPVPFVIYFTASNFHISAL